jgi:hypothetical protein
MQNMYALPLGPAEKRQGTIYAGSGKTAGSKVLLVPWVISPTEGRMLEFGHNYIRFYSNGVPILSGGVPVEVTTTYTESDLPKVRVKQVTTFMHIVCDGHKEAKLTRTSDTVWTLADVTNTAGAGEENFSTNWPKLIEFYEDRKILANTPAKKSTFWGSEVGVYENFDLGTNASDPWEKTPLVQRNAEILWLLAGDAFLFGTSEGPFRVGGTETILTGDEAWWPQIQAAVGCANIPALMVDEFACFVGKSGKHLYRFQYSDSSAQYVPEDLLFYSGHLAGTGIIGIAHQREPESILWAWTSDGKLLSGCYSRITNSIGWTPHDLGGYVESAAVIPTTGEDQVWVSVARTIGGTVVRHIEYFAAREWEETRDYHGVDGAVVWDGGEEVTVTSISNANPAVCTATSHGFVDDDHVCFDDVVGLTDVNGEVYTVKNATTHTFELYMQDGSTPIDFSGETAGTGGTVEKVTNIVTGLSHLEGETVSTLGDGAVIPDEVVASGQITLDEFANKIRTGLPFTSYLEPMAIAEARNRTKTVKKVYAEFYKTADAQISDGVRAAKQITFDGAPDMDEPPPAHTEGIKLLFEGYAGYDGRVRIESKHPLPQTVLAVIYEMTVVA